MTDVPFMSSGAIVDTGFDRGVSPVRARGGPVIEGVKVEKHVRLRLEIRTSTDVDWCTINTANATEGAREKLTSMWYNGYSAMYPDDTEWRIRRDYF